MKDWLWRLACFYPVFPCHVFCQWKFTNSTDKGWYVYIETSSPRRPNDTARIVSPTIAGNGTVKAIRCVSFWYHMYGPHVDELRLYKKEGFSLGKPQWVRQGYQGNKWIKGEYTVEHTNGIQVGCFRILTTFISCLQVRLFLRLHRSARGRVYER